MGGNFYTRKAVSKVSIGVRWNPRPSQGPHTQKLPKFDSKTMYIEGALLVKNGLPLGFVSRQQTHTKYIYNGTKLVKTNNRFMF
jgi:hypothetical protein